MSYAFMLLLYQTLNPTPLMHHGLKPLKCQAQINPLCYVILSAICLIGNIPHKDKYLVMMMQIPVFLHSVSF